MEDKLKISLAPLQGYTDWVFRQAYNKHIGGIDEFYTPFLVLQNSGEIKSSHKREVEPFAERKANLVPQFLGGTKEEFQFFENYFSDLGYEKMNWNLGCPFSMVTRRQKGSGLLPHANKIEAILREAYTGKIKLSIKMRLGLENKHDIFPVLEILKELKISDIIIHPRLGTQMYKGCPDRDFFMEVQEKFDFPLAYNGDIETKEDFLNLKAEMPNLEHLMIGRGILKDYWLPHKIKNWDIPSPEQKKIILKNIYADVFHTYSSFLSGDNQILQKTKPFWEYFSNHFDNDRKVFKGIKKSGGFKKYEQAVAFAFQQNIK